MDVEELRALVDSWVIHLRAERKTEGTIKTYLAGVRPYLDWSQEHGVDALDRHSLRTWVAGLMAQGRSPSTAKTRQQGVRHFARWLAEEGEIDANPFTDVKPPKVDMPLIPVLTEAQVLAMIKACQPTTAEERSGLGSLRCRRDEAIVRLMTNSGLRASECINLELGDLDLAKGIAYVRRGKGGRGRPAPFNDKTAKALDRYLRVRRLHKLADSPKVWLGDRGRELAYNGLYFALKQRAAAAGIEDFHPHRMRHTSVDAWLASGGSETGAMAVFGWSDPSMLQRYGRANREQRAIDESKRLNLGDW